MSERSLVGLGAVGFFQVGIAQLEQLVEPFFAERLRTWTIRSPASAEWESAKWESAAAVARQSFTGRPRGRASSTWAASPAASSA